MSSFGSTVCQWTKNGSVDGSTFAVFSTLRRLLVVQSTLRRKVTPDGKLAAIGAFQAQKAPKKSSPIEIKSAKSPSGPAPWKAFPGGTSARVLVERTVANPSVDRSKIVRQV